MTALPTFAAMGADGFFRDMQANAAQSHCCECGESAHGGFVTGPCSWPGCPLRLNGRRRDDAPASGRDAPFHGEGV